MSLCGILFIKSLYLYPLFLLNLYRLNHTFAAPSAVTRVENYFISRAGRKSQFIISIALVCAVSLIGLSVYNFVGYRVIAFMLLVTVSILAMFLDIVPVLLASLLSALIWDFFFIPPRLTLTVGTS